MRKCQLLGCPEKSSARNYCNKHYQMFIKKKPFFSQRPTLLERILNKTAINSHTGCYVWAGAKSGGRGRQGKYKYGYIRVNGKTMRVHRVAYQQVKGEIPGNLCVCHSCDNPLCVNPEHLFLGTHKENMTDMIIKGRAVHPCGEENHSKLTQEQVIKIRKIAGLGVPRRIIARGFNVHAQTIKNIVERKKWKHLGQQGNKTVGL